MDLTLNNPQRLICYKTQTNKQTNGKYTRIFDKVRKFITETLKNLKIE